jgi:UDP-N-acetyl-D-mannosaminuronic acid transferase (WecB/TagA/CpsF family)
MAIRQVNVLNTMINNFSMRELLEKLNRTGGVVVTPNIDHLMKLKTDRCLQKAYLGFAE